ncbi:E3 ubiquitin-protein ligase [Ceratobasidium theobromae]|uniref:E3 ubiquitin-protein ligase n=1 Tax=Ceratobasidium theobromae TaxID=1582974 RepID=A0A5N5QAA9_9AGAM|nr:E3 ubiquitin-protein ligase [Ceratobasidium theobromae]
MSTTSSKRSDSKGSNNPPSEKSRHERRSSSNKAADSSRASSTLSTSKSSTTHVSKHSKTASGSASYASKASSSAKSSVNILSQLTPSEKIDRVFAGETHIISYPGTSQYSQGAPSACGLAALNFIRLFFDKPLQGITGTDLVKSLSTPNMHLVGYLLQVASTINNLTSTGCNRNMCTLALKVYDRHDKLVGFDAFLDMLNALQTPQAPNDATAALITRPPEIVAVIRIPLFIQNQDKPSGSNKDASIYAIFDSHSRPEHPTGAGLTLLPSIAAAAQRLTALLRVNMNVRSAALQWEAQLMSQFSAHLVCRAAWRSPQDEQSTRLAAVYEANAGMLRGIEAEEELKRAQNEAAELKKTLRNLERELHHANQALDSKPKSGPPKKPEEPKPTKNTEGLSEDALMALRMQEEFDAEDQLLTELAGGPDSRQGFDCGVCFETFHTGALAPMEGCSHTFCRDCMRDYIKSKLGSRSFPIICPTCHATKDSETQGRVSQDLVETIGLDEQEYATYVELSLASLSVMVHCRKCQRAAFVVRADLESQEKVISCPLPDCAHKWCKNCNKSLEGDETHSCDGTSELRELMASQGWKECPGCKTPISRNEGCYHMTVSRILSHGYVRLISYIRSVELRAATREYIIHGQLVGSKENIGRHFCYRCGELITQSLSRDAIQSAVNEHFRGKCDMFDIPVLSFVQRLRRS